MNSKPVKATLPAAAGASDTSVSAPSVPPELPEREASLLPSLCAKVVAQFPDGLDESDNTFLTTATLARYLRARNHDVDAAAAMLASTVHFRRSRGTVGVCKHCVRDPRSHSFYPIGPTTDASCKPVMYSNFSISNRDPASSIDHMIFALESLFHHQSLAQMIWVMDFHGFSRADISPANARAVLTLFADNYPERLGRAVIYGAPYIFYGLWATVKLFAAPETVSKVVFVKHSENDRRRKFADMNIKGNTYERLCKEIDEARIPDIEAKKNWWTLEPLHPLPHYGAKILHAQVTSV